MRIYLAHNFVAREWLPEVVEKLEAVGHVCTSSWIFQDSHIGVSTHAAIKDLADIRLADIFVLFVDQYGPTPGKGKYVELGYAYALGKTRIILVGEDTQNVFYALPGIERVKDVDGLLEAVNFGRKA